MINKEKLNSLIMFSMLLLQAISCYGLLQQDQCSLDINDILDEDLMPGSLMLLRDVESIQEIDSGEGLESRMLETSLNETTAEDGGWDQAYNTMGFHRKMMNEYLCRNFVADQILSEIVPQRLDGRNLDIGNVVTPQPSISFDPDLGTLGDMSIIKENMLSDEGSSGYKNWLSRMTTLEDIYRHYEDTSRRREEDPMQNISRGSLAQPDEDYQERGHVTGYAIPQYPNHMQGIKQDIGVRPQQGYANPKHFKYAPDVHEVYDYPVSGGGHGGGGGHSGFGFGGPHQIHHYITEGHGGGHSGGHEEQSEEHEEHEEEHSGGYKKDLALHEIFDIALTTLAFLSFGTFMLQVVMCITTDTTQQMTMMPMGMEPATEAPTGPEFRTKRSIQDSRNKEMNELARRVLYSFEAVLAASNDDAVCLRRAICENNQYSRSRTDRQKYWLPVWGLGLSWLSGRLPVKSSPASSMLNGLRASILGLGGADCSQAFPQCDLKALRHKRHERKRRERQAK